MNNRIFLLFAALISTSMACGPEVRVEPHKIKSTSQAPLLNAGACGDDVPASGMLVQHYSRDEKTFQLACSATLIAPHVVLTAAHCFDARHSSDAHHLGDNPLFFTTASSIDSLAAGDLVAVESFELHPAYTSTEAELYFRGPKNEEERQFLHTLEDMCGVRGGPFGWSTGERFWRLFGHISAGMLHDELAWYECVKKDEQAARRLGIAGSQMASPRSDIAVVFLKDPVTFVTPAVLPDSQADIDLGRPYHASGFGRYKQNDEWLEPKNNGLKRCRTISFSEVSDSEIMYESATPCSCFGDSGGGTFDLKDGHSDIVGVFSRVDALPLSLRCQGTGIMTKVSAFVPWIDSVIERRGKPDVTYRGF